MIDAYFDALRAIIAASPVVSAVSLTTERRTDTIGFVRGDLTLIDDSHLHFREFVRVIPDASADRYTYVYHYQQADGTMIFRYDNTPHYPDLPTAPHHRHGLPDEPVTAAQPPDLATVLAEIETLIAVE